MTRVKLIKSKAIQVLFKNGVKKLQVTEQEAKYLAALRREYRKELY